MGILSWIFFGLFAGAVAKVLTPGKHGIGCFGTIAVGLVGAVIGGFIGETLFGDEVDFGWDLGPFLLAVAGSAVLLLALNALKRR